MPAPRRTAGRVSKGRRHEGRFAPAAHQRAQALTPPVPVEPVRHPSRGSPELVATRSTSSLPESRIHLIDFAQVVLAFDPRPGRVLVVEVSTCAEQSV
jgi:hypothetical protein